MDLKSTSTLGHTKADRAARAIMSFSCPACLATSGQRCMSMRKTSGQRELIKSVHAARLAESERPVPPQNRRAKATRIIAGLIRLQPGCRVLATDAVTEAGAVDLVYRTDDDPTLRVVMVREHIHGLPAPRATDAEVQEAVQSALWLFDVVGELPEGGMRTLVEHASVCWQYAGQYAAEWAYAI